MLRNMPIFLKLSLDFRLLKLFKCSKSNGNIRNSIRLS